MYVVHPKYIMKCAWTCLDDGPVLVVHEFESEYGLCCLDIISILDSNTGLFVATYSIFLNTIIGPVLVDTNNQDAVRPISDCHCKMSYSVLLSKSTVVCIVIQLIFYSILIQIKVSFLKESLAQSIIFNTAILGK